MNLTKRTKKFSLLTNDTNQLLSLVLKAAEAIFKGNFQYYKAGIYGAQLVDAHLILPSLFDPAVDSKQERLMQTLDRINHKLDSGSIQYAAVGLKQNWETRVGYRSKRYIRDWHEWRSRKPDDIC
jgi:DNA polymerase V